MRQLAAALAVCCILSGFASSTPVVAQNAGTTAEGSQLRVGTFDSRLIAVAYVRSEAFKQRLANMHADLTEAKESGNEKLIKQLEAEGSALQNLIHKQGFSTWPVHDILQVIKKEIPKIANQAKVDMLVSKWDVVFQRKDAELVDVTDLMVAPFSPNEETRRILEDLRKKDPVPLDQLDKHN